MNLLKSKSKTFTDNNLKKLIQNNAFKNIILTKII